MGLSTYLPSFLGNIYSYLGWDSTDIDFIITETLESLGITDESSVEAKKLHAVAKVKSLEKALVDLSIDYQVSADGSSFNRQQVFEQVSSMLAIAQTEAWQYMPETQVQVGEITYEQDPYSIKTYFVEL